MPQLFGSSTANGKYSLFMGPREANYFNWLNTEIMEIVAQQNFNYWPIEADLTDTDDLYGEAEKKVSRNPIQVYGLLMLDEPETRTDNYGTETRRRVEAYLHIDRLTEVGVYPKKGDFIEWDSAFFEITEVIVPQFVHGLPQVKIGVTVRCISTREDIFNPALPDIYTEEESSSQDPY